MRVALVNPNRLRPPIAPVALPYLRQALEAQGHDVTIVDLCFADAPLDELARALSSTTPGLVAVTVRNTDDCFMASSESFVAWYANLVRAVRAASSAPVVLGGSGFSATPQGLVRETDADLGVVGDGEVALPALASAIERGEMGEWDTPLITPRWADVPHLPSLDWTGIDVSRYFREGGQLGVETKRGCPMACIYCADPLSKGTALRLRHEDVVVEEIRRLVALGIDHFHLCDAEINIPRAHLEAVCDALARAGLSERVRWYGYATPAGFDEALALACARGGCAGINFGSDAAHDGMLARLGRNYTAEDVERAVRACRCAGIAVMLDLLLGGPGETRDSICTTLDRVRAWQPTCVGVSLGIRLYPGTALTRDLLAAGPLSDNPSIHGSTEDNADLLQPVFYLDAALGPDVAEYIGDLLAGDRRFFFGGRVEEEADYNYNDNRLLVQAIAGGARGAYWHILAGLRGVS